MSARGRGRHAQVWQTVRTLKNPQLVFYGLFVFLQNKLESWTQLKHLRSFIRLHLLHHQHPGRSTWIFSDHHLQLSDLRHHPLRDQAVQQGILGHLEAQGGQLRMGFGRSGRSYGGGMRVRNVGEEHAAGRVAEGQRRL